MAKLSTRVREPGQAGLVARLRVSAAATPRSSPSAPWVRAFPWLVVIAILVVFPHVLSNGTLFFWEQTAVDVLFAMSTNVLFGWSGIPSFGQAAFFGIGAYTVGMLEPHSVPAPLAVLLGMVLAGIGAGIASLFMRRSSGLAFAMLTLAVAQALYTLVIKISTFGGYNGLTGVVPSNLGPWNLSSVTGMWYFVSLWLLLGLAALAVLDRSALGLTLRAIREDPLRTEFLGVPVNRYRGYAFVIAGVGAGLAGALYAYVNEIVAPSSLDWTQSTTPIIMLLLGGMYSFWGPALGGMGLSWMLHDLSQVTPAYIFYVGVLILLVIFILPGGITSLPARAQSLRWPALGAKAKDKDGASRPSPETAAAETSTGLMPPEESRSPIGRASGPEGAG